MLHAIERNKGKEFLDRYYNLMFATGYLKQPGIVRLLVWLFLVDFTELVYDKLTEEDYQMINDGLICMFSSGCCLLPYKYTGKEIVYCDKTYAKTFVLSVKEYEALRDTMQERLRRTE